jgi:hypothetical protein
MYFLWVAVIPGDLQALKAVPVDVLRLKRPEAAMTKAEINHDVDSHSRQVDSTSSNFKTTALAH